MFSFCEVSHAIFFFSRKEIILLLVCTPFVWARTVSDFWEWVNRARQQHRLSTFRVWGRYKDKSRIYFCLNDGQLCYHLYCANSVNAVISDLRFWFIEVGGVQKSWKIGCNHNIKMFWQKIKSTGWRLG